MSSFYRREDGTLLAGDALSTMNLDSLFAAFLELAASLRSSETIHL